MAKIQFGALVTDFRGKIGGTVFSKNRSCAYTRNKVTPVNPQTNAQAQARSRLTGYSQGWRGLTAAQRQAWNDATGSFPRTNQFGQTYYLSGNSLYVSLNSTLSASGNSAITDPPVPGDVTAITSASLAMAKGAGTATVTFTPTPWPANMACLIFATPGMSPGINFVKTELRQIGVMNAADVSPLSIASMYTAKYGAIPAAGQKVFVQLVPVNTVTGQQGQAYQVSAIVAA